jgi:predicted alpha/beta superfamily hydrolase
MLKIYFKQLMNYTLFKYFALFSLLILRYNFGYSQTNKSIKIDKITSDNKIHLLRNWRPHNNNYLFGRKQEKEFNIEINNTYEPFKYKFFKSNNWKKINSYNGNFSNNFIDTSFGYNFNFSSETTDILHDEDNSISENVAIIDTAFYIPQLDRKRRIWIYLPPNYKNSDEKYPVIYMQDGQNLFNNFTSFAGEWRVDETVDSLITLGTKEAIIVGIDNGGRNRINEYTPFTNDEFGGGEGSKYMSFVVNNLKPHIDSLYRTLPSRDNTSIVGSSLGGLISFYGIMKYKHIFSKAVIMSPSLWFSDKIYYIPQYRNRFPIKLLFMAGNNESEKMIPNIEKMLLRLKKMKYPKYTYSLKIVEGGKHTEKYWGQQFAYAYKWIVE